MMSRHAHDVYHKYTWCIFGMLLPFLNEHTLWPQAQATCSAVHFLLVEALRSKFSYLVQLPKS